MTAAQVSRLELGTRNLDLEDWVKILSSLGEKPGDWLDNSGSTSPDLQPVVQLFAPLNDVERHRMMDMVKSVVGFADERARQARIAEPAKVIPFDAHRKVRITLSDDERDELAEAMTASSLGTVSARKVGRSDVSVPMLATVAADPEGKVSFRRMYETRDINRYHWERGVRSLVKVEGDSMLDMGIVTGDLLYIRPTDEPHAERAIVCTVGNTFFVKVYNRRDDGAIVLSSRHKTMGYPDIVVEPDQVSSFNYLGEVFGRYGDL